MYAINQYVIVDDSEQDIVDALGIVIENGIANDGYKVRLSDSSKKVIVVSSSNMKIASRQRIIENNQVSV